MKTSDLVDLLASHHTIGKAPREELLWIAENGTFRTFDQGEIVSSHLDVVEGLYILLTGRLSFYMHRATGLRKMLEWQAGDVTGLLPFSRMEKPPGDTIVEDTAEALMIRREDLPSLVRHCYEVTAILVHVMTDRARRFTSTDLRDEKMISLGRLAAGLAHEVNNPASAALRDAKSLADHLTAAEEAARTLWAAGLTGRQLSELDTFCETCRTTAPQNPASGLLLADREDEMSEWLRNHAITEALAEDLARTPVTVNDLDRIGGAFAGETLDAVLRWITAAITSRLLGDNIERAATRIHSLVAATKGFTHMDRAPVLGPVELPAGITDSLALLDGKAREKSIVLTLDLPADLPPIRGYAVEINQVWMNLIDNAIDAAPNNGHVTVTAFLEGWEVIVTVVDDGPGIAPEIRETIFDPFFTTKPIGEGTGLGLDIVRRIVHWHNGNVTVDSRPGRTEFRVRLPVGGP